jgi:hypothetical protein
LFEPDFGRSRGLTRTRSHDGAHANSVAKSYTCPEPKLETVLLHRVRFGRSRDFGDEAALSKGYGRSRSRPQGRPRGLDCDSTRRSGSSHSPSSRKLPPTDVLPKRLASARHAAWEFDDNSHGVRFLPAFELGRSLRRFTSPAPSTLRVSHPLSGLSPPGPRGFDSRPIPPEDVLVAFRAFPSRSAVTPLGARCSLVVSAGFGFARLLELGLCPCFQLLVASSRLPDDPESLARVTPMVSSSISSLAAPPKQCGSERAAEAANGGSTRTPNSGRPVRERSVGAPVGRLEPATSELFSDRESVLEGARLGARSSRCSLDLWAPPRSTSSAVGLAPSPHVLAPPTASSPEGVSTAGFTALQGVNPVEPGSRSEDRLQPPWGL